MVVSHQNEPNSWSKTQSVASTLYGHTKYGVLKRFFIKKTVVFSNRKSYVGSLDKFRASGCGWLILSMQETSSPAESDFHLNKDQEYNAAQIDKLEGLAGVRQRPGMYIGPTDERGLHHCVFEVLDNSIDEHLAGFCTKIDVTIHMDGSCSIRDNGRGIPVDISEKFGIPAIELVLTNLHAGGKFGQGAYKYSGGLHGVGAKCVNALSDWFKAEVSRNGKVYHMAFERGVTTQKLTVIGELPSATITGTLITFLPDPTIFTITTDFKFERLASRLRELAFLNPGLEIMLADERSRIRSPLKIICTRTASRSSSGSWVRTRKCVHPLPIVLHGQAQGEVQDQGPGVEVEDDMHVDCVMQYNKSFTRISFCSSRTRFQIRTAVRIPSVSGRR